MGDWPWYGDGQLWTSPGVPTTVAAAGTPDTKGSVTQLWAATPHDATGIMVMMGSEEPSYNTLEEALIDILVGDSPNEEVLIPNLFYYQGTTRGAYRIFFPIPIPAATRISCQLQSSVSSEDYEIQVCLLHSGWHGQAGGRIIDVATNTSTTNVLDNITVGTSGPGSWFALTTSLAEDIKGFWLVTTVESAETVSVHADTWIDIGVGAAASEVAIVEHLACSVDDFERGLGYLEYIGIPIAAGTRVSVRAESTSSTDQIAVGLYGLA